MCRYFLGFELVFTSGFEYAFAFGAYCLSNVAFMADADDAWLVASTAQLYELHDYHQPTLCVVHATVTPT
jgi:hypothetical protein